MKKFLIAVILVISEFGTMAAGKIDSSISDKMVQTFKQTYPDAVDITWITYPETYIVNFKEGAERSVIIFSKDGTFLRATRYYTEEHLPYYLVAAIQERYPAKKIYYVTEVSTPGDINYYIKLQDGKTWMTIKVDSEGDIKVIDKYKKA